MAGMDAFVAKHAEKIRGTLSCFDRVLFRGYLLEQAERIKKHAHLMLSQSGRPHQYLSEPARKEDLARKIAARRHQ